MWARGTSNVEPLQRHLIALALLFGLAVLRWWSYNQSPYFFVDELSYFHAFAALQEGGSPYDEPLYLYPPPLAVVGARLTHLWGERWVSLLLRHLNLLGGCVAAWLALAWARWPWLLRLGAAVAIVSLTPPFTSGVTQGNLSLLAIGVALTAFSAWPRWPILAGLLLGMSLALKPMAAAAVPVLLLHHSPVPGLRHRVAAALSVGVATALLLIGWAYLPEMPERFGGRPEAVRITSLHRLFYAFGVELPPLLIASVVVLVAVLIVRRRPGPPSELMAIAATTSLLSLPVVWSHTMLLALPIQGMAMAVAVQRLAGRADDETGSRLSPWFEASFVLLGVISIFLSNGFGAPEQAPSWILGLLIAVPTLSPAALTAYLLTRSDAADVVRPSVVAVA